MKTALRWLGMGLLVLSATVFAAGLYYYVSCFHLNRGPCSGIPLVFGGVVLLASVPLGVIMTFVGSSRSDHEGRDA